MEQDKLRSRQTRTHGNSLSTLVDRLSAPILLVDRTGALRYANSAGSEALNLAQYLVLRGGRVWPRGTRQRQEFVNMLAIAPVAEAITAQQSPAMRLLDVKGQSAVLVAQTFRGQADLGGIPMAEVVLFLIHPNERAEINSVRLRIVFGLTPAETRLAEYLIRGANLAEISRQLSLSRETLKTQLHSVFTKTETHRQGELIALLHSVMSLFVA